jgi:hypothetical protein
MIRRNPTLIPMDDLDVQDVRDLVAQQKQDRERQQRAMARVKEQSDKPLEDMDPILFNYIKDVVDRQKRLGIQEPLKGPSSTS